MVLVELLETLLNNGLTLTFWPAPESRHYHQFSCNGASEGFIYIFNILKTGITIEQLLAFKLPFFLDYNISRLKFSLNWYYIFVKKMQQS